MNNKEAIANLNHIYGMVAPDIQRSLDVAIKALERPQGECEKCEYLKFTEKFVECCVNIMLKYGITSIEELKAKLDGGGDKSD